MKVMHVITGLRIGGAENQLQLLARHTRTRLSVVALTNADEVADGLRADGVQVFDLGMRGNRDVAAVGRLARLMAAERPDVVHVHLYRATVYGRLAARLARVPVVVSTEHSLLDGVLEGRRTTARVRGLYMATEPFNSATVAVSQEVAARLVRWGVAARKVHVIPNGVDFTAVRASRDQHAAARRELGIPLNARVIGGIGRLHSTKRWDLLLRAVAPDLGPERQVLLVGSGPEETSLRDLGASLGVAAWIHLVGSRSDLADTLAVMDVVVSPSPQETFGLALVEAAVAGRPVVYVSCPGLEALSPLEGAAQVPPQEAPLRQAVRDALREPELVPAPAALARYDIRSVAREIDALYDAHRRPDRPRS